MPYKKVSQKEDKISPESYPNLQEIKAECESCHYEIDCALGECKKFHFEDDYLLMCGDCVDEYGFRYQIKHV